MITLAFLRSLPGAMRRWPGSLRIAPIVFITCLGGCSTPRSIHELPEQDAVGATSKIIGADFSDDSRHVALLCENGDVVLWDVLGGREIDRLSLPELPEGALDLGGRRFAFVRGDGVRTWHIDQGPGPVLGAAGGSVAFIRLNEPARRLAIVRRDGSAEIWSLRNALCLERIPPPEMPFALRAAEGMRVLYFFDDRRVTIRNLQGAPRDTTLDFARDPRVLMAVARDGHSLASLSPEGVIEIRSLPSGRLRTNIGSFEIPPRSIAISPDGSTLAVDLDGQTVELWDTKQGLCIERANARVWRGQRLSFSPDGYFVSWVAENREEARFWSPVSGVVRWESGEPVLVEEARRYCSDLASMIRFRRAGEYFAIGQKRLEAEDFVGAIRAFGIAREMSPYYPELAATQDDAEGRYQTRLREEAVLVDLEKLEAAGDYGGALGRIDRFLEEFPSHRDFGQHDRAFRLRAFLEHFELAEAYREVGRSVDALEQFEAAAAIQPRIRQQYPHYETLRCETEEHLVLATGAAFDAQRWRELLALYSDLVRLRPLDPRDWLRCGEARASLGEDQRAQETYGWVREHDPEYVEARWRLSILARKRNDFATAKTELERARVVTTQNIPLERDYAEVLQLLGEVDGAIAAWRRVGDWRPEDANPLEKIAHLEEDRLRWVAAAEAYRQAFERSQRTRPTLLFQEIDAYREAGDKKRVLSVYLEMLAAVEAGQDFSELGSHPQELLLAGIRDLGCVHHRGQWLLREDFLDEQGWVRHGEIWMRPEEEKLRTVASRFETEHNLRSLPDSHYRTESDRRRMSKGMKRREVIQAWGFFADQNVYAPDVTSETTYEQFIYLDGRQVYLKDGLVCFWSE